MYKKVESTNKPARREVNNGDYYLRKNITLRKGEDGNPDMYCYEQAVVSEDEYFADIESEMDDMRKAIAKLQRRS
jgi:hypothetical protein